MDRTTLSRPHRLVAERALRGCPAHLVWRCLVRVRYCRVTANSVRNSCLLSLLTPILRGPAHCDAYLGCSALFSTLCSHAVHASLFCSPPLFSRPCSPTLPSISCRSRRSAYFPYNHPLAHYRLLGSSAINRHLTTTRTTPLATITHSTQILYPL